MVGFTFNGRHSDQFSIYFRSENRTMLPAKRQIRYEIPGRDGYLTYGEETYDNRIITATITFTGRTYDLDALWLHVREIAQWLSGRGKLIFDDEPDKAYEANVIGGIDINQMAALGQCQISFDCEPFAKSPFDRQMSGSVTQSPFSQTVTSNGTVGTPCIISVRNTGTTDITGIRIERKVKV